MHIVKPEKSKTVGDYILELQRHFLSNLVLLKKCFLWGSITHSEENVITYMRSQTQCRCDRQGEKVMAPLPPRACGQFCSFGYGWLWHRWDWNSWAPYDKTTTFITRRLEPQRAIHEGELILPQQPLLCLWGLKCFPMKNTTACHSNGRNEKLHPLQSK